MRGARQRAKMAQYSQRFAISLLCYYTSGFNVSAANILLITMSLSRLSIGGKNCKTFKLVEHPVPVKPLGWKNEPPPQPTVYLTEKERKRQRRLNRAEKLKELRDKQALGLIPAEEPKLTLGNFMKVMGDSAVMDPSKMEAVVQKQIQARQDKHFAANDARKLTKEQKAEKKERKR